MEQLLDIRIQVFRDKLPQGAHGFVIAAGAGSYQIMINAADPEDEQRSTFLHEMLHVYNNDFQTVAAEGIQSVEIRTHEQIRTALECLQSVHT